MGNDAYSREAQLIIKKISNLLSIKDKEPQVKITNEKQQELDKINSKLIQS